jgi:hypothetical protein
MCAVNRGYTNPAGTPGHTIVLPVSSCRPEFYSFVSIYFYFRFGHFVFVNYIPQENK